MTQTVNPVFTFWIENKIANKRKFFTSDLRQLFQKWLRKQEIEWLKYNGSLNTILYFISAKNGLNATHEAKQTNELAKLLKLDYAKHLALHEVVPIEPVVDLESTEYKLFVTENPKAKTNKFTYLIVNGKGKRIFSCTNGNGNLTAATIDGKFFFLRKDTIGKNEHGKYLKACAGWRIDRTGKFVPDMAKPKKPVAIAYLTPPEENPYAKKVKKTSTTVRASKVPGQKTQKQIVIEGHEAGLTIQQIHEQFGVSLTNVKWYFSNLKLGKV